jgi:hypothetical protein
MLSELKNRPVCSADLNEYLAGQEHAELGYIQAFGQILIKAAIVRPGNIPRLHAAGIFRNRTYYSADNESGVRDGLDAHWHGQDRGRHAHHPRPW